MHELRRMIRLYIFGNLVVGIQVYDNYSDSKAVYMKEDRDITVIHRDSNNNIIVPFLSSHSSYALLSPVYSTCT